MVKRLTLSLTEPAGEVLNAVSNASSYASACLVSRYRQSHVALARVLKQIPERQRVLRALRKLNVIHEGGEVGGLAQQLLAEIVPEGLSDALVADLLLLAADYWDGNSALSKLLGEKTEPSMPVGRPRKKMLVSK